MRETLITHYTLSTLKFDYSQTMVIWKHLRWCSRKDRLPNLRECMSNSCQCASSAELTRNDHFSNWHKFEEIFQFFFFLYPSHVSKCSSSTRSAECLIQRNIWCLNHVMIKVYCHRAIPGEPWWSVGIPPCTGDQVPGQAAATSQSRSKPDEGSIDLCHHPTQPAEGNRAILQPTVSVNQKHDPCQVTASSIHCEVSSPLHVLNIHWLLSFMQSQSLVGWLLPSEFEWTCRFHESLPPFWHPPYQEWGWGRKHQPTTVIILLLLHLLGSMHI